jgi:Cu+-exporting ATPase
VWAIVDWAAAPLFSAAWANLRRGIVGLELAAVVALVAGCGWSVGSLVAQRAAPPGVAATAAAPDGPMLDVSMLCAAVVAGMVSLALYGRWVDQRVIGDRPDGHLHGRRGGVAPVARVLVAPDRLPLRDVATQRVAGRFLLLVVVLAAGAAGFWWAATANHLAAVGTAIAIALLAYPVGLGLGGPLVLTHARRRATEAGVQFDDAGHAAAAARIDTIVVRRSGTLTTGQPAVVEVTTADGTTVDETLRLVGSLGQRSGTPIGRAIAATARRRHIPLQPVEVLADRASFGLRAVVDGRTVLVGRERFLAAWARPVPAELVEARAAAAAAGRVTVFAGWDREVKALLVLNDPLRPTAVDATAELADLGVRAVLVSGDDTTAARAVASSVGIAEVVADIGPDETGAIVARLQRRGQRVVTLGEEHDDPARAHADVVIAGAGGQRADLWAAVDGVRLGRTVDQLLRQNQRLACAPNVLALPLAATGRLTPTAALAATTLSAATVILNSSRIRRFRTLRPPAHRWHTPDCR